MTLTEAVRLLLQVIGTITVGSIVASVIRSLNDLRNPNLHPFPSLARCPICDKRIYVWQKSGYRTFDVPIEGLDPEILESLLIQSTATMLTHMQCEGEPRQQPRHISVFVDAAPRQESRSVH
ncbi:MAG TPA: hypothetical protein VGE48_02135 [Candidatus Paceibacterota bacterium]